MGLLQGLIYFIRQTPNCVADLVMNHPVQAYIILGGVLALETASILFCFLPGDILLFILGGFVAKGDLSFSILAPILILGATFGSLIGYLTGRWGRKIADKSLNKEYQSSRWQKAFAFNRSYGGFALLVSRFIPFFRSCMPMVCGIVSMEFNRFMLFNLAASIIWVSLMLSFGYSLSELPFVKENLDWVITGGVILLLMLSAKELIKKSFRKE